MRCQFLKSGRAGDSDLADAVKLLARAHQSAARTRPCRVADIAQELAIGWAGVSKIVDRIEAAGHCQRSPNPNDARSSHITLTPPGRAKLDEAAGHFTAELQCRLGAALPPTELAEFASHLSRLRNHSEPATPTS